ncbi:DUF4390 domain-containing protein [Leeia sp. TBRC 13508]|uniref:DUF4390 domain-containing protein n=1 Tax=Leeia speluncae TaxID=2884804 RepID=A0ABS8D7K6_9NEIS|nr:DUF4390 domain-containing protein [Leeia speluncae]MCB6184127.1 DUF4390 domain-containing protein [Leeia speluncae]
MIKRYLRLLLISLAVSLSSAAYADISFRSSRVTVTDDGYQLNAHFNCALTPSLEDALRQGVSLGFVIDLEINKSRRYWFDANLANLQKRYRLSYYALTRQYKLYYGGLVQNFSRLDTALGAMCNPPAWNILEKSIVEPGLSARIRMQLDTDQLPKPFQINTITSKEWSLDSDWKTISLTSDSNP